MLSESLELIFSGFVVLTSTTTWCNNSAKLHALSDLEHYSWFSIIEELHCNSYDEEYSSVSHMCCGRFWWYGWGHGLETAHELRGFVIPRPKLGPAEIWAESEHLQYLNSRDSDPWFFCQKRPESIDFWTYSSETSHMRSTRHRFGSLSQKPS